MKSTRCLVECFNSFCINNSRFYDEIFPIFSLIKRLYYTIRDIADNQAVLEGFVFLRIDLALGQ